jgi:hypothetical protein
MLKIKKIHVKLNKINISHPLGPAFIDEARHCPLQIADARVILVP